MWHLRKKGKEDERDPKEEEEEEEEGKTGESKQRRRRTPRVCVCVVTMYDVQISPELFGTMVRASCSQPTDPWLRFLHM